jgi:hypothetical protein
MRAIQPPCTVNISQRLSSEWQVWLEGRGYHASIGPIINAFRDLGMVMPDPKPIDYFMAANPGADRTTAEMALNWRFP